MRMCPAGWSPNCLHVLQAKHANALSGASGQRGDPHADTWAVRMLLQRGRVGDAIQLIEKTCPELLEVGMVVASWCWRSYVSWGCDIGASHSGTGASHWSCCLRAFSSFAVLRFCPSPCQCTPAPQTSVASATEVAMQGSLTAHWTWYSIQQSALRQLVQVQRAHSAPQEAFTFASSTWWPSVGSMHP